MRIPKMYVLVRNDLSKTYQMVQGAHALAQFALKYPKEFSEWGNSTIVFLGIRNLIEMRIWMRKLFDEDKICIGFMEPDLDNQITAIACFDSGEIFRELKTV